LDLDVTLDKVGLCCDSTFAQRVDVMAVQQPFIEPSSIEPRRGMENREDVKGAVGAESGWRQTKKNADDENTAESDKQAFSMFRNFVNHQLANSRLKGSKLK
jgi:hypothetical protein